MSDSTVTTLPLWYCKFFSSGFEGLEVAETRDVVHGNLFRYGSLNVHVGTTYWCSNLIHNTLEPA